MVSPRTILTAPQYAILALALGCFIVYGSLIPLSFEDIPFEEALRRFEVAMQVPKHVSRSDVLANLLLYFPWGYLLMGSACADGPRRRLFLAAPSAFLLCAGMSLTVEFMQVYVPQRNSTLADAFANAIGGSAGILLWCVVGQRWTMAARRIWSTQLGHGLAGMLLPAYLVVLFLLHIVPFDLTLSPGEILHKYRSGRIRLVPFHDIVDPFAFIEKHVWNAAHFFPVGWMSAFLPASFWSRTASMVPIGLIAVLTAFFFEFVQIFVISRYFDIDEVITGTLAICAGWLAARAYLVRGTRITRTHAEEHRRNVFLIVFVCWLAMAAFITWRPFDFRLEPAFVRTRLNAVIWIPFFDYQAQDYVHILEEVVKKGTLYGFGGALLVLLIPANLRSRVLCACIVIGLIAVTLEIGQLFLPERFFSVSDIVIEWGAGTGAAWLIGSRKVFESRAGHE